MQISMGMTVLSQKKIERAEFDQRMEEHAKWLKNHEEGKRADFSDVDLSEMDLSGMDFSYAEMKGVNLGGANLTRANLSPANLWGRVCQVNCVSFFSFNFLCCTINCAYRNSCHF